METNNSSCRFAKRVLLKTLSYAASLIPEISSDIYAVDEAMRLGYNWKYGVFELIDKLSSNDATGSEYLLKNRQIKSKIIEYKKPFYNGRKKLNINGKYDEMVYPNDTWELYNIKLNNKPVLSNLSGSLWDIGNGIACFEFASKNNFFDMHTLKLLNDALNITNLHFEALVIGNDSNSFSVGVNLKLFFKKTYKSVEELISYGQETFHRVKFSRFPVVAVVSGFTVGGGCEIVLHSDRRVAHIETYCGLVETNIGVIPGWGGCKEILLRYGPKESKKLFEQIFYAKLSKNAFDIKDMRIMNEGEAILMNKKKLLPYGKQEALNLVKSYSAPTEKIIKSSEFEYSKEDFSTYDHKIAEVLYKLIVESNGKKESDVYTLERKAFMRLIKQQKTQDRIQHMFFKKTKLHN